MRNDKSQNVIVQKTFNFALEIIEFTELFQKNKNTDWQISCLNQEQV